jgi:phosphoribosylglycinamide formyltransferase-1
MRTARVAVLASGGGSNLQAILDHLAQLGAAAPARVVVVISDRANAGALDRARAAGVRAVHIPASEPDELARVLEQERVDVIALAGYLRLVPAPVTRAYRGRILNIHPALLPQFGGAGMYGRRVHEAVLRSGATESGATVHLVDEEYDRGPILDQIRVPVLPDDTPETLAARVLEAEHRLYPKVLCDVCKGN